jgi:putative transcriptional regulator
MNKIKFYRVQKGLQLKDIAVATRLTIGHLSHLENGSRIPSKTAMEAIAEALGQTVPEVFYPSEAGSEDCTAVEKGGSYATNL